MDRDDSGAGGTGGFYETAAWDEVHAQQTIVAFSLNDDEIPVDKGGRSACGWRPPPSSACANGSNGSRSSTSTAPLARACGGRWEDADLYDRLQLV